MTDIPHEWRPLTPDEAERDGVRGNEDRYQSCDRCGIRRHAPRGASAPCPADRPPAETLHGSEPLPERIHTAEEQAHYGRHYPEMLLDRDLEFGAIPDHP